MDAGWWLSATNIVALLAGLAVGLFAGRMTSPAIAEAKKLRDELDRTVEKHESYRASVNTHFRKTADLVGNLTRSYAAVYDHLATGARRFCDEGDTGEQLPFGPLPGALASPVIEGSGEEVAPEDPADREVAAGDAAVEDDAPAGDPAPDGDEASSKEQWPTDVALDGAAEDEAPSSTDSDSDTTTAGAGAPASPPAS